MRNHPLKTFASIFDRLGNSKTLLCPIHVVTFTLISNLATDYIQMRRGEPWLSKSDYRTRAIIGRY